MSRFVYTTLPIQMAIRDCLKECECHSENIKYKKECKRKYKLTGIKGLNTKVYSADCLYEGTKGVKHCDHIVICDLDSSRVGIYLVEQKSGNPKTKFVEQLQNCARFLEKRLEQNEEFSFMPVLVADGLRGSARAERENARIDMRGNTQRIEHVTTKSSLPAITA